MFLDFAPPRAFDFDQKLTQNVAQIILYYHVTKQFDYRICFGKTLVAFDFDEKFTQSVTQIISRVKRLSLPAPCGILRVFNLRI